MLSHHTPRTSRASQKSRKTIRTAANAWRCEALEGRRLLAVSLSLGGAQTAVPGATLNVSADNGAGQSEMSLVINPTNPLNLVGFSHRLGTPITMDLYRSINGGTTWTTTRIDNTDDGQGAAENRFDPAVTFDANGRLYIAYGVRGVAGPPGTTSRLIAAVSTDGGVNFTNFRLLDTQNDIGGAGGSPPGVDRWTLSTGRDPATGNQACYIAYTQNATEGAAGTDQRIVVRGTRDGGANWDATVTINDGSNAGTDAGNLGASPVVSSGGEVFVTWWDSGTTVFADRDRDGLWANAFNFGTDLTVRNNAGLVNVNGAPAQPERGIRFSPSLAINSFNRDLYVTFHERVGTGSDTDIMFGRSSDFGDTWTWVRAEGSTGSDFNPWIAWDEDSGAIGIAYYSTEGDQATGNDDVRPRMALSTDNGNNWSRAFLSNQTSNEGASGPGGLGYGGDYLEYNGFAFRDGTAHHLWASRYPGGGTDLDAFTTRISLDSASNGNVLRIGGIGGAPDDSTVIRRSPVNNNFIEVFENNVRTYTGLLASIDSITIETGGGVHAFSFENLPAIPVNMAGGTAADVITFSSISGISGLTLNTGEGADTVTLGTGAFDANTINVPVTVLGGAGADTLVIGSGNADAVAANVTFDGGAGGGNSIVYNDTSPTYVVRYDVLSNRINRDGINAPFDLFYSNVTNEIRLNCGAGSDTVKIRSGVTAVMHAFGNGGGDTFVVGGGNLNGFFPQDVQGGPGIDQLTYDDSANPAAKTWDINETNHPNEIIYSGLITLSTAGFESVGILAGTGGDNFTFNNDIRQNYSVDGGALNANIFRWNAANNYFRNPKGPDAVYAVDLVLGPRGAGNLLLFEDISRLETDYFVTNTLVSAFDIATSLDGADVHYHNADFLTINGSNVSNTFQLASAHPDTSYNFFARGGGDRFDLTLDTTVGGPSVRTDGNDGVDSLFITDTASAAPANYAITSASVTRTSVGGSRFLSFNTMESINVTGTAGDDTFGVGGFNSGAGLTVNGGLGNDVCNFGNGDVAATVTSMASFLFNGMEGTDTFNLRNANPANSFTYTAAANTTLQANRTFPSAYSLSLEYYNTEQKAVYAGPAVDIMNITSFASGELSFHGAGGDDTLNLPTSSDLLGRRVNFYGDAGTLNRITQSSNTKSTPTTLHIFQNTIGAFPGDNFFAPGGSVFFESVQTMALRMGTGADTAFIEPNPVARINLSGDLPVVPGDQLNLALAATANPVFSGSGVSGSVTSSNRATVTYSGFETGPNIDDVAPVVVDADININGVAGFADGDLRRQSIDVRFSENASSLIGPSSITLMNLTTNQPIPTSNIAVQYDLATNTAHFTFPAYANGVLPDGDYEGRVLAGLPDLFGNGLPADVAFDFFFLQGDANRDRAVNLGDFNILAANFGQSNRTFSQADFNYDGSVNLQDFNLLAAGFGRVLAAGASIEQTPFARVPITARSTSAYRELATLLNDALA